MNRHSTKAFILSAFAVLTLFGCGGGGGGGGASAPATKAITKAYMFGNMSSPASFGNLSSSGKIASVRTNMAIPTTEVMLNYSSITGATSGLCVMRVNAVAGDCILRDGVIVPSGKLSASDFAGSRYNIATKTLTISMTNGAGVPIKISTTGNGTEFATINFTLVKAGVTPSTMPVIDQVATIGEDLPNGDMVFLPGRKINFQTTYQ
jgi:hypothetical protein